MQAWKAARGKSSKIKGKEVTKYLNIIFTSFRNFWWVQYSLGVSFWIFYTLFYWLLAFLFMLLLPLVLLFLTMVGLESTYKEVALILFIAMNAYPLWAAI